jgi:hypothetical protein
MPMCRSKLTRNERRSKQLGCNLSSSRAVGTTPPHTFLIFIGVVKSGITGIIRQCIEIIENSLIQFGSKMS